MLKQRWEVEKRKKKINCGSEMSEGNWLYVVSEMAVFV